MAVQQPSREEASGTGSGRLKMERKPKHPTTSYQAEPTEHYVERNHHEDNKTKGTEHDQNTDHGGKERQREHSGTRLNCVVPRELDPQSCGVANATINGWRRWRLSSSPTGDWPWLAQSRQGAR